MAYGGLQWLKRNLPLGSVTYAEIQDVAANKVLGRTTGTGTVEEITCTSFARSILDDADAATVRATIGAGTGSGSGDVTGPSSAVDNCVARFDGTTGKLIQSSGVSIDDSGNITANNLSGTNTGDQATVSGNAGTATKLATARAINGVSFDGSADITVTAAASTLTGTTLASGVTASSLTSFGASPALGTPASGVLTNCTGLPTSGLLNGAVTLEIGRAHV